MYQYWRFYWPLALTGVGLVLAVQFQNATLARYPEAVAELAVLALAHGVFGFFNASLQFVSQLANVYARSRAALAKSWRFVVMASCVIGAPLVVIASTTWGATSIELVFGVSTELAQRVQAYLILMCPLVLLNGQRHYFTGLLIQSHRTGWVTTLNFAYLSVMLISLIAGFTAGMQPVHVIVGSELLAVSILLALLLGARMRVYRLPETPEHADVTYTELLKFFVPVSTTGVMFAFSRPVLFAFVARTPDGVATIAALRIAFDFSMLFQQAANQFRHFFISFGFDEIKAKRRFMALIAGALTLIMLAVAITPLADWIWGTLMGIPSELQSMSEQVLLVMCLMPVVIIYRNYFHSQLMHLRRTAGMAYGSMLRVAGIFVMAALLSWADLLDHRTAALTLICGFIIEALISRFTLRSQRKQMS